MRMFASLVALAVAVCVVPGRSAAQGAPDSTRLQLLVPDAVWDGTADTPQRGWVVLVRGRTIQAVGPEARVTAAGAERVALAGTTLIPGLIEGHSHLFLHPYN